MAIANRPNSGEPKLVKVKRAKELGKKGTGLFYETLCPNCGKVRWLSNWAREHTSRLCPQCASMKRRLNMPNAQRGTELGMKNPEILYKDHCPKCGVVKMVARDYIGAPCKECNNIALGVRSKRQIMEKHPRWAGGKYQLRTGYIVVTLPPDSPYISMATGRSRRVFEHRLVMAMHLGRPLETWEIVHHCNRNRADNRIDNLELLPNRAINNTYTALAQEIDGLKTRIETLTKLVRLLLFMHNQYGNPELNSRDDLEKCVETRGSASSKEDDGIVQSL